MSPINVLVLGSGGREYAFVNKILQSGYCGHVWVAPGNPMMEVGVDRKVTCVSVKETDFEEIKNLVLEKEIDLVIVGPEAPLVAGIVDFFENDISLSSVQIIGPSKAAAMLEGSKAFAKEFMERHGIPTARYHICEDFSHAAGCVRAASPPYVIKADGLAGGKGVVICDTEDSALEEISAYFEGKFGDAGKKIVIEEFLEGKEISVFVFTDGNYYVHLPTAQDYKRLGTGNTGPNTGGMGAISPAFAENPEFMKKVEKQIIIPTIDGMKKEGTPYTGFLYIGLMSINNEPYVIEYNCRMGDPETQVVLPRWSCDILEVLCELFDSSSCFGEILKNYGVCVVLAAEGYGTNDMKTGEYVIHAPAGVDAFKNLIFAGVKRGLEGELRTSGGRVASVCCFADTSDKAIHDAYVLAHTAVEFKGKQYRMDIGLVE